MISREKIGKEIGIMRAETGLPISTIRRKLIREAVNADLAEIRSLGNRARVERLIELVQFLADEVLD